MLSSGGNSERSDATDDNPDEAKLVGSDDSDEYQTPSEMLTKASA